MHKFAELFESLDTTTSTRAKVEALVDYFRTTAPVDAAWATYVLTGRRVKRSVGPALLRTWLSEEAGLPDWLVEETYGSVGDLAETIALLIAPASAVPGSTRHEVSLSDWFHQRILRLPASTVADRRREIVSWWHELPYRESLLVNKLLTGSLRVGVSRALVVQALAEVFALPRTHLERALLGSWEPTADFWHGLRRNDSSADSGHPYPFYLASPLEGPAEELGDRNQWLAEWKWDGIRGQIVRRGGRCTVWSRGEEIISERFPEICAAAAALPEGTVLDGELLAWGNHGVRPFAQLQQRIGRRQLSVKILQDIPARFIAYDLLEWAGEDWRGRSLRDRRAQLLRATCAESGAIGISPALEEGTWAGLSARRGAARSQGVEGLMLKQWDSPYGSGRQRGAWWKWKIDPYVFDGVLLYAAPGHGRRSNLYTDYTFGIWQNEALVPIAKAYSGLTDGEIRRLDHWIRSHTRERFGMVRSVEPVHVFELAYEGIALSSRHKSGLALRFPRIRRWRTDKSAKDADTLTSLQLVLADQPRNVG